MQGVSRASGVTNQDKWKEEEEKSLRRDTVQLEERLLFFTSN